MQDIKPFVLGIVFTLGVTSFLVITFRIQTAQISYEQVHRGEIQCVDTPDGEVYCWDKSKTVYKSNGTPSTLNKSNLEGNKYGN